MKTTIILISLTLFGSMACAQEGSKQTKAAVQALGIQMEMVLPQAGKDRQVTRLYKFKNSRVKRALSFTTKNDVIKLA